VGHASSIIVTDRRYYFCSLRLNVIDVDQVIDFEPAFLHEATSPATDIHLKFPRSLPFSSKIFPGGPTAMRRARKAR
jgi:hypothetical protein